MTAAAGARLDGPSVPQIGMVTVRQRPGESLAALARRLRALPAVRAVAPERRFVFRDALAEGPDDPALRSLESTPGAPAGTPIEWWAAREDLQEAWSVTHGDGAKVAVIDSGIDASHPEFAGKIAHTADFDGEPGDGPAILDRIGHGTHVAGLACAAANNGVGIVGAGYDCRLLVEKSDLTEASVIESIVDATDHGAQSINMSFGTDGGAPPSPQLREAIRYAYRHNVILVAAAADEPVAREGDPADVLQPPGSGSQLTAGLGLTVTSADFADHRSAFAGYGSEISLAAYGSFYDASGEGGPPGILSTFPANQTTIEQGTLSPPAPPCAACRTTLGGDDRYAYLAGTSMAAPQVAAVAALIRELAPSLSAAQVIQLLKLSARRPLGASWNSQLGWGILDAGAAVSAARAMARTLHAQATRARRAPRRSTRRPTRCPKGRRSHRAGRSSSGRCRT
jgi:subtilisin family serine protease